MSTVTLKKWQWRSVRDDFLIIARGIKSDSPEDAAWLTDFITGIAETIRASDAKDDADVPVERRTDDWDRAVGLFEEYGLFGACWSHWARQVKAAHTPDF